MSHKNQTHRSIAEGAVVLSVLGAMTIILGGHLLESTSKALTRQHANICSVSV